MYFRFLKDFVSSTIISSYFHKQQKVNEIENIFLSSSNDRCKYIYYIREIKENIFFYTIGKNC